MNAPRNTPRNTVVGRLVLQLALAAAFGISQLVPAMPAVPAPVAGAVAQAQPAAAVIATTPQAPVGIGWG